MPLFGNRLHGVLQNTVNAVFDRHFSVARFDVNIACSAFERGEDDGFDEFDDGAGRGIARNAIAGERFVAFFFGLADLKCESLGGLLENTLRLLRALDRKSVV